MAVPEFIRPGERGIPLFLAEAEMVAEKHRLDPYHRFIIETLIWEIKRLRKDEISEADRKKLEEVGMTESIVRI